jgi:hypothetical protein
VGADIPQGEIDSLGPEEEPADMQRRRVRR